MIARIIDCDNCGHCIDFSTPKASDPYQLTLVREEIAQSLNLWLNKPKLRLEFLKF